jgi:hypothetical protein
LADAIEISSRGFLYLEGGAIILLPDKEIAQSLRRVFMIVVTIK